MANKKAGLQRYTDPSGVNMRSLPKTQPRVTAAGGSGGETGGKNYRLGSTKITGKGSGS